MPVGRPDSEETDILFYIAKHRFSVVLEKILHHVFSQVQPASDLDSRIYALDTEIMATYAAMPEQFRIRSMSESVFASPTLVVARFCVNMMYEKCRCVLHRPHVATGRKDSILACNSSANNIVECFIDAHTAFRNGGHMEMERWFMSAITWHDFLLGCAAACLVLCSASRHGLIALIEPTKTCNLLRQAQAVLSEHAAESRDAVQVQKVVNLVLLRFADGAHPNTTPAVHPIPAIATNSVHFEDMAHTGLDTDMMNFGWDESYSQPITDLSWAWLEEFLNTDQMTA